METKLMLLVAAMVLSVCVAIELFRPRFRPKTRQQAMARIKVLTQCHGIIVEFDFTSEHVYVSEHSIEKQAELLLLRAWADPESVVSAHDQLEAMTQDRGRLQRQLEEVSEDRDGRHAEVERLREMADLTGDCSASSQKELRQ